MTFSIAACDPRTGMFGVCVATSSIAVGNRCPWARAGAGAVLTQHRTDTRAGPLGLDLLTRGYSAAETINILVAGSEYPEQRQFSAIDRNGTTAFYSGPGIDSINAGHVGNNCVSVGNFLANPEVPAEIIQRYLATPEINFAPRLISAIEAGLAAGGETQPIMASALLIVDRHSWPLVDLRVDFEPNPLAALRKLWVHYEPLVDRFVLQVLRPFDLQPLVNPAFSP